MPPYRHGGADIAYSVMVGLFAVGEYTMQFRGFRAAIRGRAGKQTERWSLGLVLVTVVGSFLGGIAVARGHAGRMSTGAWTVFASGLVFMAAGIAIRWWAIIALGASLPLMSASSQIRP